MRSGPRSTRRGRWARALLLAAGCVAGATEAAAFQVEWHEWWLQHEPEFVWGQEPWSVRHADLFTGRPPPPQLVSGVAGLRPTFIRERPRGAVLRRGFVYARVVPALQTLSRDDEPAVRAAATYALGLSVEPRHAALLGPTLQERLHDPELGVKRAALVAMGQVYDPATAQALLEVVRDTWPGRRLTDSDRVPEVLSLAAVEALGYAADETLVPALLELFDRTPENEVARRGTLLAALGVGSGERAPQVAARLHPMLSDYWLDKRVRQFVPMALAHLGDPRSVDCLMEFLEDDDVDARLRVGAVRALAGLASADDGDVVTQLLHRAFTDKDPSTRRYALMGLFRMLARDDDAFENYLNHVRATTALSEQFRRPRHRNDQPFMALAAGVYLRAHPRYAPRLRAQLEHAVIDYKDPKHRGAYLIALGLARNEFYGEQLLELFRDQKPNQGEAALALGMLGYAPARDALYELLLDHANAPFAQLGAALMLLDDERAAPVLLRMLEESGNFQERTALALALGYHRTEPVAEALLERALTQRLDATTRAEACVALGELCTPTQLPIARECPPSFTRPTLAVTGGGLLGEPPLLLYPIPWSSIYSGDGARPVNPGGRAALRTIPRR